MKLQRSLRETAPARFFRQRGLALLIVLLGVLGVFGFLFVSTVLQTSALVQRQRPALPTLDEARLALIGTSIGNISAGQRPGSMPFPDGFGSTEVPPDYDGNADGGCLDASKGNGLPQISSGANLRCLGRLPWKSLGMSLPAPSENDVAGLVPWYAVSGNLVDPICLSVLNSNTLNVAYTSFVCGGATLPYPWLTVRDGQGNVISNRVAVVLIMPGPPLATQSRPPSPNLAGASQYLDSVTIGGTTYSNSDMDNDFIIGEQSPTFNDVVTYITIDDLMRDVESAAASTALDGIRKFKTATGTYPWLAPFADPSQQLNTLPTVGTRRGLLPVFAIDNTTPIYYPAAFEWQVYRTGAAPLTFVSGTVTSAMVQGVTTTNNAIWRTGTKCALTLLGAKEIKCVEVVITGLPGGVSYRNIEVTFSIAGNPTFAAATASALTTRQLSRGPGNPSGWYSITDYNASGSAVGTGDVLFGSAHTITARLVPVPLNAQLPAWFTDNLWHQVLYASLATDFAPGAAQTCGICLTVGERSDVQFAVVAAGGSLSGQTRPSALLSNYLEALGGVSNADGDDVFTASHLPKSTTFNDQVFPIQ